VIGVHKYIREAFVKSSGSLSVAPELIHLEKFYSGGRSGSFEMVFSPRRTRQVIYRGSGVAARRSRFLEDLAALGHDFQTAVLGAKHAKGLLPFSHVHSFLWDRGQRPGTSKGFVISSPDQSGGA
jgi:hypothetical protein